MPAEFETLLQQTLGLNAASIGSSAIERAVQERRAACQLRDTDAYWDHVRSSEAELQELIETVVVPETWFFRDREAFTSLASLAFQEWLPAHPQGIMRLLSLPCATGEEPYSMAMALFGSGFPADRFTIEAIDISARAIACAEIALYGKNSFRGRDFAFRTQYFKATTEGYLLADMVRRQVHFQQGNIFDEQLLPKNEIYDMIFCRNLLIYFDRPTQDRAIAVLQRLLAPKGVIFVGPAETNLLMEHPFVSTKMPRSFSFRKGGAVSRKTKPVLAHRPVAKATPPPLAPRQPTLPQPAPSLEPEPEILDMEEALRLADQGRLAEASRLCEAFLSKHEPTPKAFYLLGLVRDAAGAAAEAAGYYRKALYLDPEYHEALLQLAFLVEKQGDLAGAKVLQERARRLEQKRKA